MKTQGKIKTALVTAALLLSVPAQAGFFDFLFGPPMEAGRYPGGKRYDRRVKQEAQPYNRDALRYQEQTDKQSIQANKANIKKYQDVAKSEGITAALFKDHTLRRGDILVTPDGFIVYGGKGSRSLPLEQTSLKNRADLQNVAIALPED